MLRVNSHGAIADLTVAPRRAAATTHEAAAAQQSHAVGTPNPAAVSRARVAGPTSAAVLHGAASPVAASPVPPGPMLDAAIAAATARALHGLVDPMAILFGLEARLRDVSTTMREHDAVASMRESESADARRLEQLEKAEKAAKRALSRAPRWVRKLVGSVLSAAGAVASAFTGGASVALTVVGVALLVAGDVVERLAAKGVIDPDKAQWAVVALKVVGAIVMAVAGSGGFDRVADGVRHAGTTCARVIEQSVQLTKSAVDAHGSLRDGVDGVRSFRQGQWLLRADRQELAAEEANTELEDATDDLAAIQRRFARVAARLREVADARGSAMIAATRQIA